MNVNLRKQYKKRQNYTVTRYRISWHSVLYLLKEMALQTQPPKGSRVVPPPPFLIKEIYNI
jgi:hypothetical protein